MGRHIFISLYNINKHECDAKSIYLNDTKKYILITIIIESSNKHGVCVYIYTIVEFKKIQDETIDRQTNNSIIIVINNNKFIFNI